MALKVLQQTHAFSRNLREPWRREKLVQLGKLYASRAVGVPFIKPRNVTITLTTRCNLSCIMCNHWRLKPGDMMSYEEATRYIDQIVEWGIPILEVSGGEPMLHPRFDDIIRYASAKGQHMNITTNAMLLTRKRIGQIFESKVERLQISMDGPDAATHDKIRGMKGSFDHIVKTVKILDRLRVERNRPLGLNLTMVIQRDNFTRLVEMYHFVKSLGFDSITYQPVNDDNLDITYVNPENPLRVPLDRIEELDEQIDRLVELRTGGAPIGNAVHYLQSVKKYFRNEPLDAVKCYAGYVMGVISPDGKMWSCMGNYADLSKENIQEAWHGKAMSEKRNRIKKCVTPCLYPCYLESDADSFIGAVKNTLL